MNKYKPGDYVMLACTRGKYKIDEFDLNVGKYLLTHDNGEQCSAFDWMLTLVVNESKYTPQTAYEAMRQGAKNKKGDPVYDWIHGEEGGNREKQMMNYINKVEFDQYLHDCEIWVKIMKIMKNEDEEDEEIYDLRNKLFRNCWIQRSRIHTIVSNVLSAKNNLIDGDEYMHLYLEDYKGNLNILKLWLKEAGIGTKFLLIEQLADIDSDCLDHIDSIAKKIF